MNQRKNYRLLIETPKGALVDIEWEESKDIEKAIQGIADLLEVSGGIDRVLAGIYEAAEKMKELELSE